MDFMALLLKLFNVSISASCLVVAVIVFRLLFRKAPKAITVFLWALVAIRLICPVSFESNLSLIPSAETIPTEILNVDPHKGINSTTFEVIENPVYSEYIDSEVSVDSIEAFQWDTVYLTLGWLCGVGAMVLYSIISYLRIYFKIRLSAPLGDNIFICDTINTPFIFGIIRPRIYLPSSMSEEDMSYVIAHEKAHLKRKDYIWKPLGFLLLTVYWFNPVLWVAYVLLCRDIELACDEKVIKEMGADIKKPYSMALINCSAPRRMISACPVAFGEVGVKKRIKAVLNYKKPAFRVIAVAVIVSIAVAVCFMTDPVTEKTQAEEEFLWYCNPSYSAVGYGQISFSLGEEYEIIKAECTSGSTSIYNKNYNDDDGEKLVGWSPDFTDYKNTPGADITIYAEKDGEEKVYKVSLSRTDQKDEKDIGVYYSVSAENCSIKNESWALYTLSEGENVISADLDEAVAKAILKINADKSWLGECPAEGHVILGTETKGYKTTVYLLERFACFGFENGWFLVQSGHSTAAVMTFENTEKGYKYIDVEYTLDGAGLGPSIKRMFPKKYENRALSPTDEDGESMWKQCVAYAESYLKEIGREANIGTYGDIDHILLTDLGVSVEVSNKLLELRINYDTGVVGYFEKLEEGTRYIYRTSYLADKNIILYTKEVYGTNKIVERIEVDSLTGNIISTNASSAYFDAKVLDVEKNGDFVLVEPFENTNERKCADKIWVSLNVSSSVPVPDVYEGVYIRIMYDGRIEETYPAKIPGVSAIYLYADVNYIGDEAASSDKKEPTTTRAYYIEETTIPSTTSELVSVGEAYHRYSYTSDNDMAAITLYPENNTFTFSLSLYSSYLPAGTYEENDGYVILKAHDTENVYTFRKSGDNLIFIAEESSAVPKYKYNGANTKATPCIIANAVFDYVETYKSYFDKVSADIDNDGITEDCVLGYGPTSGIFTFSFLAYEKGEIEYFNTLTSDFYNFSFEEYGKGKIRIRGESQDEEPVIRYFDISIENGNVVLTSEGEQVAYWGEQGKNSVYITPQ